MRTWRQPKPVAAPAPNRHYTSIIEGSQPLAAGQSYRLRKTVMESGGIVLHLEPFNEFKPAKAPLPNPFDHVGVLYGITAIANALGLPPGRVRSINELRGLRTFKMAGRVCARRKDVRAWLDDVRQTGGAL